MTNMIAFTLFLLLSFSTAFGQLPSGPVATCKPGSISHFDPKYIPRISQFLKDFQLAVASNAKDRVASMMRYPLRAPARSGTSLINNKVDFIKSYDVIFSPAIRKIIESQRVECINVFSQGFMIDRGQVWFNFVNNTDELKVITINPPVPESH